MKKSNGRKTTTITFSAQLPDDMFFLLRDVAIARHLTNVATRIVETYGSDPKTRRLVTESIGGVLADLIERHRDSLEAEAVRGGVRRPPGRGSPESPE